MRQAQTATFFERVAGYLDSHLNEIAAEANNRTFREIPGYAREGMPRDESESSVRLLINFVISQLKNHHDEIPHDSGSLKDLVIFEQGVARGRVHYRIDLIDVLHGVRIARNTIWDYLRRGFADEEIEGGFFFGLEKRINTLVVFFSIAVTEMYLAARDELIESQRSALSKWDEVVKSASRLDLKIPCREEFAAIVRAQAEAIARRLNCSRDEVNDIVMAVGEACDNSIEHGFSEKGIDLHYTISPEDLMIEVVDYGKGFEPSGKGEENPDLFAERGRGIFIMKHLVDRLEIESKPGEGTRVRIIKRRNQE